MGRFLNRERFGHPQFIAGLMLLAFLGQCLWLVNRAARRGEPMGAEVFRLQRGLRLWHGDPLSESADLSSGQPGTSAMGSYDPNHSPLWYLAASAPLLLWSPPLQVGNFSSWVWLARIPSLAFAVLLGASLWYVSRRLYGNAGGYVALALFCFSPAMIRSGSLWFTPPEMGAAWGAFGTIFTAIAVAHTLYAPREVVLWNWRRIVLLGLSLALAIGSQFSLVIVVPVALILMLYLAPTRRGAALAIWAAANSLGLFLIFASCAFRLGALYQTLAHADFSGVTWKALAMPGAYLRPIQELAQSSSPALWVALAAALATYAVSPRARYFGNTAPLLMGVLFLLLGAGSPHYPGLGFPLIALPFLFVFIGGATADLIETRHRNVILACLWGVLSANALWNLAELAGVGGK